MKRRVGLLVKALLMAVAALLVVFVLGMRAKSPPVLRAVRRTNRAVFNPQQMKSAGTPGAYASIIRHVGRSSGASHETPVGVVPTDGGFVIALPYGTQADWLRNVLAAGSATIVTEGSTYEVDRPEVIPIGEAAAHFTPKDQRSLRFFGVGECLRVRRLEPDAVGTTSGADNGD